MRTREADSRPVGDVKMPVTRGSVWLYVMISWNTIQLIITTKSGMKGCCTGWYSSPKLAWALYFAAIFIDWNTKQLMKNYKRKKKFLWDHEFFKHELIPVEAAWVQACKAPIPLRWDALKVEQYSNLYSHWQHGVITAAIHTREQFLEYPPKYVRDTGLLGSTKYLDICSTLPDWRANSRNLVVMPFSVVVWPRALGTRGNRGGKGNSTFHAQFIQSKRSWRRESILGGRIYL